MIVFTLAASVTAFSQTTTKSKKKFNLGNRAGDHIMLQLSNDHWSGAADSVSSHIKGFSKGANIYVMLDKPFKGNERFSAAVGIGIGTSSISFNKMFVDINATNPLLPFRIADTTSHFKKYKLTTAFLEIPVELRFTANPSTPNKSVKAAIGVKIGTMLGAHTKGKILQDASGKTINSYTEKISTKSYFNTTRLTATARVGYGIFSLFGAYSFTTVFKDGVAPDVKVFQIGLTISGL